jgi:hypothetical protein
MRRRVVRHARSLLLYSWAAFSSYKLPIAMHYNGYLPPFAFIMKVNFVISLQRQYTHRRGLPGSREGL